MANSKSRLIDVSFPSELLLQVIEHVSFEKSSIPKLRAVHPRIRDLVGRHEFSVTKSYSRSQLPHAFNDFPCESSEVGYRWLAQCIDKYDVIDDVMAVLIDEYKSWAVARHNMGLTNTGMLLLYRLSSIESHMEKITFINSLQRDPLVAMFLAAHYSTKTARLHGRGMVNERTSNGRHRLRADVEIAFSEAVFNLGPKFVADSLIHDVESADRTLLCFYRDHNLHLDDQQDISRTDPEPLIIHGPEREPGTTPVSLSTTVMERIAHLTGWDRHDVTCKIKREIAIPGHAMSWIGLVDKNRLLQGLDLEPFEYDD